MSENELDQATKARYARLFANYGEDEGPPPAGTKVAKLASSVTKSAKERITSLASEDPALLRPDAAHFLLTTFDQMLVRPFLEPQTLVLEATVEHFRVLMPERGRDAVAVAELPRNDETELDKIQAALLNDFSTVLDLVRNQGERPVTSRTAMSVIQEHWDSFEFVSLAFGKSWNP